MRRKPMQGVRDEIKYLIERHNPEYFYIIDDSFLARPEQEINEFIEMYKEFQLPFWFNTRPENVTEERLSLLKSINCDRISFGLECGNEEFRQKIVQRHPTNEEIVRYFDIIADSRIAFSVNNIIGFPDETREMIFETIELNRRLHGYDSLTVSIFTPYHGTKMREMAVERGYLNPDVITTHTTSTSLLDMPQLSANEIDKLVRAFTLYVKFPKSEWPNIKIAEEDTPEGAKQFARFQERYREQFFRGNQDDGMEDWDAPTEYSVTPQSDTDAPEEPWGFNCGSDQRQYAVRPNDPND